MRPNKRPGTRRRTEPMPAGESVAKEVCDGAVIGPWALRSRDHESHWRSNSMSSGSHYARSYQQRRCVPFGRVMSAPDFVPRRPQMRFRLSLLRHAGSPVRFERGVKSKGWRLEICGAQNQRHANKRTHPTGPRFLFRHSLVSVWFGVSVGASTRPAGWSLSFSEWKSTGQSSRIARTPSISERR